MSAYTPAGTARLRFAAEPGARAAPAGEPEQQDALHLGWEIARCATGLSAEERRTLAALAAAVLASVRAGSTRLPVDERLGAALEAVGAGELAPAARALLARAGDASDPLRGVVGAAGERTPLVLEGGWLYAERMRVLDERFCRRVRERLAQRVDVDKRAMRRALDAVAGGPPQLTEEQTHAVRAALAGPIALVTGGPGTGKTTIVVAILRALAWTGLPMEAIAVAAPTGKAAQRLQQAIDAGLAAAPRDLADAGLRATGPAPQTMHRLLGWSPSSGRFARHENDPLPHRFVVVDEASMIDLALMDRLLRALRHDARLVLLGDADQLPSIEAGAVFRDLCAALGAERLATNLRVARDADARRIVAAAAAVNAGTTEGAFAEAVHVRRAVGDVTWRGVEHLAAPWSEVADAVLERWWNERVASLEGFERRVSRAFRMRQGCLESGDAAEVRTLLDHHGRSRLLCVTRMPGPPTSADEINLALLARLGGGVRRGRPRWAAGVPVLVEKNDYDRQLFNGDQGIILRVEEEAGAAASLRAVFARGDGLAVFPLDGSLELAPAFAMTVHKAQGSELDHAALVLPERDMPLLTRELVYTAITRVRRSFVLVGAGELLTRAVSRTTERYSGIAETLAKSGK